MDSSFTYCSPTGQRVMLYAPPEYGPPDAFPLMHGDNKALFHRLSDRSLECGRVGAEKPCMSADCHRRVIGECQCGRHETPLRFERAVRSG